MFLVKSINDSPGLHRRGGQDGVININTMSGRSGDPLEEDPTQIIIRPSPCLDPIFFLESDFSLFMYFHSFSHQNATSYQSEHQIF
jgi:hypothetical protein